MQVRQKIQRLLEQLSKGIYEREEIIRLSLLAAVAGESIFLLGPPGVAKSLIARRLKFAFRDGKSFEYLMNKFSTPDEIFGPVSIKKLKDEDRYERLTENYLPGANVVFLDEIWKAGPSIQNALLTVLNERIYRNGETEVKVNVKLIIGASNELPPTGEGLDALWDRFLIRTTINEIRQSGNFISMILSSEDVYRDTVEAENKITQQEYLAWSSAIDQVQVPQEVVNVIQMIRLKLEEYDAKNDPPFRIYDRRWKKIIRLLRTAAFLNGRQKVDLMDCFLIAYCLWSHPEQIAPAKEIVAETIRRHGYTLAVNLTALRKEIDQFEQEVKQETKIPNPTFAEELYVVNRQYVEVRGIENHFEGKYLKLNEFEKLGIEEYSTVGVYDENEKLTYRVKARKGKSEHQIEFIYNSQSIILPLKTHKVEKVNYLYKKPHPLVEKYWDQHVKELIDYIDGKREELLNHAPGELQQTRENLFVDSHLAAIVEANHRETLNALSALKLAVEKIQFYYKNI
ncbi:MAG: AAA family ATPase [Cytophagales bacterium]|nr:AAA family ATPase [Bernardetiaceae bacterium]MDW8209685.1 AAA family ATPase [Cytophagales bacterium]